MECHTHPYPYSNPYANTDTHTNTDTKAPAHYRALTLRRGLQLPSATTLIFFNLFIILKPAPSLAAVRQH